MNTASILFLQYHVHFNIVHILSSNLETSLYLKNIIPVTSSLKQRILPKLLLSAYIKVEKFRIIYMQSHCNSAGLY